MERCDVAFRVGVSPVALCLCSTLASFFLVVDEVKAQASLYDDFIDAETHRPRLQAPDWVLSLESTDGLPPCGNDDWWGRSTLDGAMASRRRPDDYRCESVWERSVRLEFGTVGGFTDGRGDGGWAGFYFQFGGRLHELFSIYYQTHLLGGMWDQDPGTVYEGVYWHAIMLEFNLGPMAFAAGPSMDIIGTCTQNVAQQSNLCLHSAWYGMAGRVSVALGDGPVEGTGLVLSADFHLTLQEPDNYQATTLLGLGLRF